MDSGFGLISVVDEQTLLPLVCSECTLYIVHCTLYRHSSVYINHTSTLLPRPQPSWADITICTVHFCILLNLLLPNLDPPTEWDFAFQFQLNFNPLPHDLYPLFFLKSTILFFHTPPPPPTPPYWFISCPSAVSASYFFIHVPAHPCIPGAIWAWFVNNLGISVWPEYWAIYWIMHAFMRVRSRTHASLIFKVRSQGFLPARPACTVYLWSV